MDDSILVPFRVTDPTFYPQPKSFKADGNSLSPYLTFQNQGLQKESLYFVSFIRSNVILHMERILMTMEEEMKITANETTKAALLVKSFKI